MRIGKFTGCPPVIPVGVGAPEADCLEGFNAPPSMTAGHTLLPRGVPWCKVTPEGGPAVVKRPHRLGVNPGSPLTRRATRRAPSRASCENGHGTTGVHQVILLSIAWHLTYIPRSCKSNCWER